MVQVVNVRACRVQSTGSRGRHDVRGVADQRQPLLFGLLFGCMGMLILHNLVRFGYSRSTSSLWLAATQACVLLSAMCSAVMSIPAAASGSAI